LAAEAVLLVAVQIRPMVMPVPPLHLMVQRPLVVAVAETVLVAVEHATV
jgi:hypothetical protein